MFPDTGYSLKVVCLVCAVVMISSCGKDSREDSNKKNQRREHEAKYSDIPLPVGYTSKRYVEDETKSSHFFSYSGGLSIDQAIIYYRQNMERLGWDIQDFSVGGEGLLTCSKRSRSCALSIRSSSNKGSRITIFVKDKNTPLHMVSDSINAKEICLSSYESDV